MASTYESKCWRLAKYGADDSNLYMFSENKVAIRAKILSEICASCISGSLRKTGRSGTSVVLRISLMSDIWRHLKHEENQHRAGGIMHRQHGGGVQENPWFYLEPSSWLKKHGVVLKRESVVICDEAGRACSAIRCGGAEQAKIWWPDGASINAPGKPDFARHGGEHRPFRAYLYWRSSQRAGRPCQAAAISSSEA